METRYQKRPNQGILIQESLATEKASRIDGLQCHFQIMKSKL